MAVSKSKKTDILENIKKSIKEAKSVAFTTNNWLTVDEITNLRKSLREINSTITLAKKTLIKIAFKEVFDVEIDDSILVGQIAIVCSNDDAVWAMWKVNNFMKDFKKDPKIIWAWSYFEWSIKNAEETQVIASIPSREVLLGRLVWSMISPISALARFFDAASKKLTEEWLTNLWSVKVEKKVEEKKEEKVETPTEEVKAEIKEETTEIKEEVKEDIKTDTEDKKEETPKA